MTHLAPCAPRSQSRLADGALCSQPRLLLMLERWQMCAWVDASAKCYAWPCEHVFVLEFTCLVRLRFGRACQGGAANFNRLERRRPTCGTLHSRHARQGYPDNSSIARLAPGRCCAGKIASSSQATIADRCKSTVGVARAEVPVANAVSAPPRVGSTTCRVPCWRRSPPTMGRAACVHACNM